MNEATNQPIPTLTESILTIRNVAAQFQGTLFQHQHIQTCLQVIVDATVRPELPKS